MKRTDSEIVIDVVGEVMREHIVRLEREIRSTDRATALIAAIEAARIDESLKVIRSWIRTVAHERSKVVEVRSLPPPWLAVLDKDAGA